MSNHMLKKSVIARVTAAAAVAVGIATFSVAPAHATDNVPCGKKFSHAGMTVQYCKLWRGNVPVYKPGAWVKIGTLVQGGSANWFVCQEKGGEYTYQGLKNYWWAYTEADNGKWGWVPEVFFSGGNNNERDAGLRLC